MDQFAVSRFYRRKAAEMILIISFFAALILGFSGCTTVPVDQGTGPTPTPTPRISLAWENTTAPHPERGPWSDFLISKIKENLDTYDSAKDFYRFCPRYKSLDESGRLKAWGEFWVAVTYYESGYNPKSSSVDVGTVKNRGSYSDGLLQLSETDQGGKQMPGTLRWYSWKDLLEPINNLDLGIGGIAPRMIRNTGLIALPNSNRWRYWAVILEGNQYQKIEKIAERVYKYAPMCKP